jgi:DNA-binding GntR family transcriptional regulator
MVKKAEKLEESVETLRRQIRNGYYGVAGQLPPRTTLEKELGIPKSTMSQVILQLQGEGLVAYSGNKRLRAIMPKKRVPMTEKSFARFLQEEGLEPVTEYLELPERKPMDEGLAKLFGVEPGTLCVGRIRRDGTKQMWYRTTRRYYLSELIDDESLAGMQVDDRYDVIMGIKSKLGISTHFWTEDTIARLPAQEEQEQLSITRNAPVLDIVRISYEWEGGLVISVNKIVMVASLFIMRREQRGDILWKE